MLRDRGGDDVEVFVGGYTNAAAVAARLTDRNRPTRIVSCGSSGEPTVDDSLGAALIDRHIEQDGDGLSERERERFASLLVTSKGPDYADKHEVRRRDLHEFATAINTRTVVPVLAGDRLVPAAETDA
jgi:2-phosphosulfolactate phosphatase